MDEKQLDNMIVSLMANFTTLSKQDGEICLYHFNRYDPRHLAAVHIASVLRDVTGIPVKINTSIFVYLWIKWKFPKIKGIKRTNKSNIDVEKEVSHVEEAYNATGRFAVIYRDYYSFTDKK